MKILKIISTLHDITMTPCLSFNKSFKLCNQTYSVRWNYSYTTLCVLMLSKFNFLLFGPKTGTSLISAITCSPPSPSAIQAHKYEIGPDSLASAMISILYELLKARIFLYIVHLNFAILFIILSEIVQGCNNFTNSHRSYKKI